MDPAQEERRGEQARQIINAPLYQEAGAAFEARLVSELAQQDLRPERVTELRTLLVWHRKYRQYFEQILVTGTMAAMDAERKRTLRERMFRRA